MWTNARSSLDGQRVVEVLGRVRVDREREPVAQVDPPLGVDLRWIVGLESAQLALFDQQRPRARPRSSSPARARVRPARGRGPCARRPGHPGRRRVRRSSSSGVPGTKYGSPTRCFPRGSSNDALPLTAGGACQTWRKRRIVSPESAAPNAQPRAEHDQDVEPNGQAWMSEAFVRWIRGMNSLAPEQSRITASTAPPSPQTGPDHAWPAHEPVVAPTSFITFISRRRAKIESRIEFATEQGRGDEQHDERDQDDYRDLLRHG